MSRGLGDVYKRQQLKTQLSQFGITPDQMFDQMNKTLIRMKDELDKTS